MLRDRGMSKSELARRLGWRPELVIRRLSGQTTITATDRERIAGILSITVSELEGRKPAPGLPHLKPVGIPVVNAAPSGRAISYDTDRHDEAHHAWEYVDRDGIDDHGAFAVVVVGESMEPALRCGDRVVFLRPAEIGSQPKPGQIVYVRIGQDGDEPGCLVARYQGERAACAVFTQDNPARAPIIVPREHVEWLGIAVEIRSRRVGG